MAGAGAIPVDLFADPDGVWEFESLVESAGFSGRPGELSIGALTEAFAGFPAGAAVVTLSAGGHSAVALVDCTVPLVTASASAPSA